MGVLDMARRRASKARYGEALPEESGQSAVVNNLTAQERELFEILTQHPELAPAACAGIAAARLSTDLGRTILSIYRRLEAAGEPADFARVLTEVEDARLKHILVELDDLASEKSKHASEDAASPLGVEPFWVKGCGFGAIRQQIRERFDSDGDGRLSEEERALVAEEFGDPLDRVQLLLDLYDADESGALDATELGALEDDVEARCERREAAVLQRFDTDGDGVLSDEERQAALDALQERFGRRHHGRDASDAGPGDDPRESGRERRAQARPRPRAAGRGAIRQPRHHGGNPRGEEGQRQARGALLEP